MPEIIKWGFYALAGSAVLHVVEEYVFPGGFAIYMRNAVPDLAPYVTKRFAPATNALFLLVCLGAALAGERLLVLGLGVAGLCGFNGVLHVVGSIRTRGYVPGVLTGASLYLPLAVAIFYAAADSGKIGLFQAISSASVGAACNAVPLCVLGLARARALNQTKGCNEDTANKPSQPIAGRPGSG